MDGCAWSVSEPIHRDSGCVTADFARGTRDVCRLDVGPACRGVSTHSCEVDHKIARPSRICPISMRIDMSTGGDLCCRTVGQRSDPDLSAG
jgi:hypothetical protein